VKDNVYLTGFLLAAGLLFLFGWEQLPTSEIGTWAITFGATTSIAVLALALYRVQMQLRESRHELALQEAEIRFARQVQLALFPRQLPECKGLEFRALCKAAKGASGDYYDIITIEDRGVIFALADISGKGVSAAILMANLQALLRNIVESALPLNRICDKLNAHLFQVTESNRFSTLFLAEWRPGDRTLTYVNAGHQPPILKGSMESLKLDRGGPPLGLFDEITYESGEIRLEEGDLIALFSDGLTEARSEQDEEFGVKRLEKLIDLYQSQDLAELEERIVSAIASWSQGNLEDDMTLVLVRTRQEGC